MKKILLHSCCAPCSSSVLEKLGQDFHITIYYYNPNIDTPLEFMRRAEELKKLKSLPLRYGFDVVVEEYNPKEYDKAVKGFEDLGEGSKRCYECYKLRMVKTAKYAKDNEYDAFATTLSVSPYKKSDWVSEIGQKLEQEFKIQYLDENFKKKDGYQRSLELSKQFGLYRQNYCGCKYSKEETREKSKSK